MITKYKEFIKGVIFCVLFVLLIFFLSFLFKGQSQIWFYVSNAIKWAGFIRLLFLFIKNPKNQFIIGFLSAFILFFIIPVLIIALQIAIFGDLM